MTNYTNTMHDENRLKQGLWSYLTSFTIGNILAFGFVYFCCQRALRFQRERQIIQRYRESTEQELGGKTNTIKPGRQSDQGLHGRDDGRQGLDLSKMSFTQASAIQLELITLEFPSTFGQSIRLAFFQTMAFPSAAKILNETRQLSRLEAVPKRMTDTQILMRHMYGFPPNSPQFQLAVSRINYMHSRYTRIQNKDMIYTLAIFACNPWVHIDNKEWRRLSVVEVAALGTFWMNIGHCFKIDLSSVKGMAITHPVKPDDGQEDLAVYTSSDMEGWRDGYDFALDLRAYMRWHETEFAEHTQDIHDLVSSTLMAGIYFIPTQTLKRLATDILICDFSERLQRSMGFSPPNVWTARTVRGAISLRRFFLRYFALPRPSFMAVKRLSTTPDPQTGRFHQSEYATYPYYVRPTFWNRYGPSTWTSRLLGAPLPEDQGEKYRPQGYVLEDVGPEKMEGKGRDWMEDDMRWCREKMEENTCPFAAMM